MAWLGVGVACQPQQALRRTLRYILIGFAKEQKLIVVHSKKKTGGAMFDFHRLDEKKKKQIKKSLAQPLSDYEIQMLRGSKRGITSAEVTALARYHPDKLARNRSDDVAYIASIGIAPSSKEFSSELLRMRTPFYKDPKDRDRALRVRDCLEYNLTFDTFRKYENDN